MVSVISGQAADFLENTWKDKPLPEPVNNSPEFTVPLIELALGRSGDKGNHCNIGIIARDKSYLPYIEKALTPYRIAEYFAHLMSDRSEVIRYQLPALNSINIVMTHCLGGGGMASLRIDPQGKALAQQLLSIPIPINKSLYEQVAGETE